MYIKTVSNQLQCAISPLTQSAVNWTYIKQIGQSFFIVNVSHHYSTLDKQQLQHICIMNNK
jgi:hypothetical protein